MAQEVARVTRFRMGKTQFTTLSLPLASARPVAPLTPAERQVVALLLEGRKLIGYELGLSESTVATHLMRAAKKLGVRSRAGPIRHFRLKREAAAAGG